MQSSMQSLQTSVTLCEQHLGEHLTAYGTACSKFCLPATTCRYTIWCFNTMNSMRDSVPIAHSHGWQPSRVMLCLADQC